MAHPERQRFDAGIRPHASPTSRWKGLLRPFPLLALVAMGGLLSCEFGTNPTPSSGPRQWDTLSTPTVQARLPDSSSWRTPSDSGRGSISSETLVGDTVEFHVRFQHPTKIGTDTLRLSIFKYGVRTAQFSFVAGSDALVLVAAATRVDPVAKLLLTRLDSLHKVSPSTYPAGLTGIVREYAQMLVDHDLRIGAFPSALPFGISAAAVDTESVILAVSQQDSSLRSLVKIWNLRFGFAEAKSIVQALLATGKLSGPRGSILFPPSTVVWTSPLLPDSSAVVQQQILGINGRLKSPTGFAGLDIQILKGGANVTSQFNVLKPSVVVSDTSLAFDVRTAFLRPASADSGHYTVQVFVRAANGDSAIQTTSFTVVKAGAGTVFPPLITRLSPSSDTTIGLKDSVVVVSWRVTDIRGLKEVDIQGAKADSVPSRDHAWQIAVALRPGQDSTIHLRALGNTDSASWDSLHVHRAKDQVLPSLTRNFSFPDSAIQNGTVILGEKDSLESLSWTVGDNFSPASRLVVTAGLAGDPAPKTYPVDSTGKVVVPWKVPRSLSMLRVTVTDQAGNKTEDNLIFSRPLAAGTVGAVWDNPAFKWDAATVVWQ
jgi:hypothetical protein